MSTRRYRRLLQVPRDAGPAAIEKAFVAHFGAVQRGLRLARDVSSQDRALRHLHKLVSARDALRADLHGAARGVGTQAGFALEWHRRDIQRLTRARYMRALVVCALAITYVVLVFGTFPTLRHWLLGG